MDTSIDFARPHRAAAFLLLGISGANTTLGVDVARSWRARLRGWLGRDAAPTSRGLWLVPCDAVHTVAMRFPIDLVFVDAGGRILRVDHRVPPWRLRFCLGAYSVIELAAGRAEEMKLLAGDQLERVKV